MIVKRSSRNQVVIPRPLIDEAGLTARDVYFDVSYEAGEFRLRPVELVDRLSPEELRKLDLLFDDPHNRGPRFRSWEQATSYLKRRVKRRAA